MKILIVPKLKIGESFYIQINLKLICKNEKKLKIGCYNRHWYKTFRPKFSYKSVTTADLAIILQD